MRYFPAARHRAVVARILRKMVMSKRVSVTGIISISAPLLFKPGCHFVADSARAKGAKPMIRSSRRHWPGEDCS